MKVKFMDVRDGEIYVSFEADEDTVGIRVLRDDDDNRDEILDQAAAFVSGNAGRHDV